MSRLDLESARKGRVPGPLSRSIMSDVFVGIDVSKDHLDVASRPAGTVERFGNDAAGIAQLSE